MFAILRKLFGSTAPTVDKAEASIAETVTKFAEDVRADFAEARQQIRDRLGLNIALDVAPAAIEGPAEDAEAGKRRGRKAS